MPRPKRRTGPPEFVDVAIDNGRLLQCLGGERSTLSLYNTDGGILRLGGKRILEFVDTAARADNGAVPG